jgi:hypothetical protein
MGVDIVDKAQDALGRSTVVDDIEEGADTALKHVGSMKMEEEQPKVKRFVSSMERYKKAYEKRQNWFRAMMHLRKSLSPEDTPDVPWWQSTKPYREAISEKMEAPGFEMVIFFFILADLGLVSVELVLDAVFEFGHNDNHRLLASVDGGDHAIECYNWSYDRGYKIASTCRWISIAILVMFMTELLTKFLCAPKGFVRHAGHVLDFVVVGCSIVFEFTIHHSTGPLLIFFRLWRAVRIVHGLYEQVEYILKALETEKHLEHALNIVDKYKAYTTQRNLRDDWYVFKKQGRQGLEASEVEVVITREGDHIKVTEEVTVKDGVHCDL